MNDLQNLYQNKFGEEHVALKIVEEIEATGEHEYTGYLDLHTLLFAPEADDFSLRYVEDIIASIIRGSKWYQTSRKYSFSDTPSWWIYAKITEQQFNEYATRLEGIGELR